MKRPACASIQDGLELATLPYPKERTLVPKFYLGLLHAYIVFYFEISTEIRMAKKLRAINESCITRAEFPFSEETRKRIVLYSKTTVKIQISEVVEFSDF